MYTGLTDSVWKGAGRKTISLVLDNMPVMAELLFLTLTAGINGDQPLLTIGNTCARTVEMQFSGVQTGLSQGMLAISAQAGGETLPMGFFQITEMVTRGGQTTVTAVDSMGTALEEPYLPVLTDNAATAWAVLCHLATEYGLILSSHVTSFQSVLSAVSMASLTAGYSGRIIVGWIAGLCGCNACIDRSGQLDFLWYTNSGVTLYQQDCYEGMDQVQAEDSVFSMLTVSAMDADGITRMLTPSGSTGTGALLENNFMTQERLDALWTDIGDLRYRSTEISFLGDLRLDIGDLLTLLLENDESCMVPVMSLTQTYDGGVTTHITAQGQSESGSTALGSGALGSKVRYLSAEVAQLGALTVEDANGVTKIAGGRIDTDSLFAQDITATGTITGAQLIGAVISGEAIAIDAAQDAGHVHIETEFSDNQYSLELYVGGGTTHSSITITPNSVSIMGQSQLALNTQELLINGKEYGAEEHKTYTAFRSNAVSGTVLVSQKNGFAMLSANITLSGALESQTTILSGLPGTQHGYWVYTNVPATNSTSVKPLTVRIGFDGDLQAHYGGAGSYVFTTDLSCLIGGNGMIVNVSQVITALCVPLLTTTWAAVWRIYRRYQGLYDGMKCILRIELIREHAHYVDKGWIPVYAMENVLESYRAYHTLGGNGTVSKMVEELKRLPTRL